MLWVSPTLSRDCSSPRTLATGSGTCETGHNLHGCVSMELIEKILTIKLDLLHYFTLTCSPARDMWRIIWFWASENSWFLESRLLVI